VNTKRSALSPDQLRAIWTMTKAAGLDEGALRDLVEAVSGQRSTRGLTMHQASQVLDRLSSRPEPRRHRHRKMDGRPNMATGAQLRKIEAMWAERARAHDKAASLRQWLNNRFSISDLRFLSRSRASNVIVALEKMEVY